MNWGRSGQAGQQRAGRGPGKSGTWAEGGSGAEEGKGEAEAGGVGNGVEAGSSAVAQRQSSEVATTSDGAMRLSGAQSAHDSSGWGSSAEITRYADSGAGVKVNFIPPL